MQKLRLFIAPRGSSQSIDLEYRIQRYSVYNDTGAHTRMSSAHHLAPPPAAGAGAVHDATRRTGAGVGHGGGGGGEAGEGAATTTEIPSLPMEENYENDVSRVFISLNNADGSVSAAAAPAPSSPAAPSKVKEDTKRGGRGGRRGASTRYQEEEEERAGALAGYFSSLFDESFCSHNFKLVG